MYYISHGAIKFVVHCTPSFDYTRFDIFTLVNVNALAKARTYRLRQFQRYG